MAITTGNDFDKTSISNELVGLYYYYLSQSRVNTSASAVLGFCPTIQSASYNPFINEEDLNLLECNFDTTRFGTPSEGIPKCYRIMSNPQIFKTLLQHNIFYDKDEPILGTYPFRYFLLFDGFNTPLVIKPQHITDNLLEICVRTSLNQNSKYTLFAYGYKGDRLGNIEGIINNSPMLAPVTSSAYSQFLATSSSKFMEQNNINMMENEMTYSQKIDSANLQYKQSLYGGLINNGLGFIGSLFGGNIGGMVSSVANGVTNTIFSGQTNDLANQQATEVKQLSDYAVQRMELATINDYMKTPRAIKSLGNDLFFNMNLNKKKIMLYEYSMNPVQTNKVRKFLKRFGYKIGDYLEPHLINIRSRKYYNFIKFTKCDITGDIIPREHLEEMKTIFENGVTFWHVDNGAIIKEYNYDNVEV